MKKIMAVSLIVSILAVGVMGFYATNIAFAKGLKNPTYILKGIQDGGVKGKVNSVATSSLSITIKKANYTVNVSPSSIIANRVWDKINFSDIKVGDSIQVAGNLASSTIEAKMIRDVSFPVPVNSTSTKGSDNDNEVDDD
jgi:hypothetical protein